MPLIVEGSQVPPRWLERKAFARVVMPRSTPKSDYLRIALINNMPDAALEDTEMQFFDLLDEASGELPVVVQLFSLAGVPRSERGIQHLNRYYFELNDLWNSQFDALIMTGTEPKCADLRKEPYWGALIDVFDWAERNTTSTILSCLAAHANVLHSDGIERQRLGEKRVGVFPFTVHNNHALLRAIGRTVRFPHSRWNEVSPSSLRSAGYTILTDSSETEVDSFVKPKKRSLFVLFQGHPEYSADTLLREYRRDIKRFLRRESPTFPKIPFGYLDTASAGLLAQFQQHVLRHPFEESIAAFPDKEVTKNVRKVWQRSSSLIYRNWLQYIVQKRVSRSTFITIASGRSTALTDACSDH
ncbi:MAG TPA: homoserine O-succinyltransferase [Terriglobales bacterium]|nr:homoserine O-succinyltransferase [Terriglobales bacterium]